MDTNVANTESKYVSEWRESTNKANTTLVFNHKLGVQPTNISNFFSPDKDKDTWHPLLWPWSYGASGNPVSIWVDKQNITLSIFDGAPLHGAYDGNGVSAQWTYWTSGYFRVFASTD
jgi:hypothetical protein